MARIEYEAHELLQIGRNNYEKLVLYCENLEMNGFWEQARSVMKKSSREILDRYVQSVLMDLAISCGELLENQKEYISMVTDSNPFEVTPGEDMDEGVVQDMLRFATFPPILLQLCGVYDKDYHKNSGEYFLDALLNILLCMSYLNDGKDKEVNDFIHQYFDKICNFMNVQESWNRTAYMARKLRTCQITCDVEWLHKKKQNKRKKRVAAGGVEYQKPPEDNTDKAKEETDASSETSTKKDAKKEKVEEKEVSQKKEKQVVREKTPEEIEKENELAREQFQLVKKRLIEREEAEKREQEMRLQVLLDELGALVGLESVKQEIQSLTNMIRIRKLRESMGLPSMDMSYHMVFTGAPGTGKTTVARVVAKIYKELGILSEGSLVETDRSGLVAGYVGQTAIKVHELVEQAMGGVLFIDEAYSLVNPDVPNDFGMEAVDTLVKLMEDHRDNLVVIVAGYTEEMKSFLKCNTGLVSRFNKFIEFKDYTVQELIDILDVMAGNAGLEIQKSAKKEVRLYLNRMTNQEMREFGNARGIRNLFEKIVMNQANRLIELDKPTREDLTKIIKEDVIIV